MTKSNQHQGDDGYTGILGEGRHPKNDLRFEVLGTLDEANSVFGMARAACTSEDAPVWILQVQRDLYAIMSEVAASLDRQDQFRMLGSERVDWLDAQIDELSTKVLMPSEFISPGDTQPGAVLDVARTVTRRAERRIVDLYLRGDIKNSTLIQYLNRLSTFCFILELWENSSDGKPKPSFARMGNV